MSELQETPSAARADAAGTAGPEAPGAPEQPPIMPVLSAGAAKRANASVIGMIIALVLSIAAFLPVVLMNPSPKTDGYRPNIDVSAVAQRAAGVAGFTPTAPDAGDAFRANYARWQSGAGSGVPTWEVGYLTPKESFIALAQTRQSNPTWLLQQVKSAPVTGTRSAGGRDWELRDNGKGEKSMVLADAGGTTVVLTGPAQLEEITVLAAAVVKSLETPSGEASSGSSAEATISPSPATSP